MRALIFTFVFLSGLAVPGALAFQDTEAAINTNLTPDIEAHSEVESLIVNLTMEESDGLYTIADVYWNKDWQVKPHLHDHSAETFIMLEGRLDVRLPEGDVALLPGMTLHIPAGVPHSAVGTIPGKMIAIFAPGGYEVFMAAEQELTDEQKADANFMAEFRAQHDIDIRPVDDFGLPFDVAPADDEGEE